MNPRVLVIVWAYTLATVLVEVYVTQIVTNGTYAAAAVGTFALSQAAAVMLFYMNMKEEPGSMRLLVVIPLMFLSGLLITLVASLG